MRLLGLQVSLSRSDIASYFSRGRQRDSGYDGKILGIIWKHGQAADVSRKSAELVLSLMSKQRYSCTRLFPGRPAQPRIHSRHSIGFPPGSDQRNPTLLQVEWGRNTRNQPVTRHGRGAIITEVVNDNDVRSRKKDAETQGRGSRIPQDASRLSASANRCR